MTTREIEPSDLDTTSGAHGTWIRLHPLALDSIIEAVRKLHTASLMATTGGYYCLACTTVVRDDEGGETRVRAEWPCPTAQWLGAIKDDQDPRWKTPEVLRQREDADRIECQEIASGRWKSVASPYWNTCVIPVLWRYRKAGS